MNKLKFKTIDLAAPKEGRLLLENTGKDIQRIEELRIKLSNFIRENFSLDEILK